MHKFDIAELMQKQLVPENKKNAEIARAMENMARAADLLDDCGLNKEADIITKQMEKIANL